MVTGTFGPPWAVAGQAPGTGPDNAGPGTALYRGAGGLVRCQQVGKGRAVLDGEVTEHHPHNDSVRRGVMLELELRDGTTAGEANVLFAGSRPFWIF